MKKDFEQLPHTADIKIRVYGTTKKELFKNALNGMFQIIGPHADGCKKEGDRLVCPELTRTHELKLESIDLVGLLVDFLSDALYLSDVHNEAYFDAEIHELTESRITATIKGVPITGFDVVELKAVTYHDLHIKEIDGTWQADIVFDI